MSPSGLELRTLQLPSSNAGWVAAEELRVPEPGAGANALSPACHEVVAFQDTAVARGPEKGSAACALHPLTGASAALQPFLQSTLFLLLASRLTSDPVFWFFN